MKTKTIAYWTITILLALPMLSGGVAQITHQPQTIDGFVHLGFPPYLAGILGLWKIAGTLAILVPGFVRLKEWAYAGFFFAMTGAATSHLVCHDPAWQVAVTLTLAAFAVASWALRPPSRRIDTPAAAPAIPVSRPYPTTV